MRVTASVERVLAAMVRQPSEHHYGFELMKLTGIKSGTLYPTLARMEDTGWVKSSWENGDPNFLERPRRRYYRLTAEGISAAHQVRRELDGLTRLRLGPAL